tara:strand:+ start:1478 stop:2536 length:1059 start_codon:yes stop_codon:yes gene_type:complete
MNKTFKKSNITNYINRKNLSESISEEEISEFVDKNGTLINKDDNYVANRNYVKSKKTTDDYVRNATQGPEAYFIYGGPYYGINYNYVVSEEEVLSEEEDYDDEMYDELNVVPDISDLGSGKKLADKDIKKHYFKRGFPQHDYKDSREWSKHSLPYDTKFNFLDENEIDDVSDEAIKDLDLFHKTRKKYSRDPREKARKYADKHIKSHYKKDSDPIYDDLPVEKWRGHSLPYDMDFFNDRIEEDSSESKMKELVDEIIRDKKDNRGIVKQNEQDMLTNKVEIPDIMELKDVHEKPMVIRKVNSLMDLINKENLHGIELSIVLNHIIDNIDTTSISEEEREIIGDKIKYVKEEK